jgi:hypothetical protein
LHRKGVPWAEHQHPILDAKPRLDEAKAPAQQQRDGIDERASGGFTLFVDDAYGAADAMRLLQERCA